jgi:hypothetical protein
MFDPDRLGRAILLLVGPHFELTPVSRFVARVPHPEGKFSVPLPFVFIGDPNSELAGFGGPGVAASKRQPTTLRMVVSADLKLAILVSARTGDGPVDDEEHHPLRDPNPILNRKTDPRAGQTIKVFQTYSDA